MNTKRHEEENPVFRVIGVPFGENKRELT